MAEVSELRLKLSSEAKRTLTNSLLSDRFGIVVAGKRCIVAAIKSDSLFARDSDPNSGVLLTVLGLAGSETQKRECEAELNHLESALKSTFSARDLNLFLVQDFLCCYLEQNFYSSKSEKPLALELILVEVAVNELLVSTIKFDGEAQPFGDKSGIRIIGCTDPEKRKKVQECFEGKNLGEMPVKELEVLVQHITTFFEGTFGMRSWNLKKKSARAPKKTPEKIAGHDEK